MNLFKYLKRTPDAMRPFGKAGKVNDIFRPRVFANGVFSTPVGYCVSFSVEGADSEGLSRDLLNSASQTIAGANRMLPLECQVFQYLITTFADDIPARPIEQDVVRRQQTERLEFLKANTRFKSIRLVVTLYLPGKVSDSAEDFADKSRTALRQIQSAAVLYERQLRRFGIRRLSPDELVQVYSYLLNLDRSLITAHAAPPAGEPKKLGRLTIGFDGEHLRVGNRYCQMLSLTERPRGTRPDLWTPGLISAPIEVVFCSVFQRKANKITRTKAAAVENSLGMAAVDLWTAAVDGYNPNLPPTRRASTVAQEKKVEQIGDVLVDVDGGHYYGHYSLFGIVHSNSKEQLEAALPEIHHVISDPSEAAMMQESRGSVSAYLSCFPGQPYNVRKLWMRGDHVANLSFFYAPFRGHMYSDDLEDEYTVLYETRHSTPFYLTPFVGGNGNTTVLGGPSRGKSLNTNAIFTGAMKYGTKTYIFDQGASYEANVRELGGAVIHMGLTRPRLNMFLQENTKDNIHAISLIVKMMLNKSEVAVGNDDMDAIEKAVERMMTNVPRELRRLRHLSLKPNLRKGLQRWIEDGIYAGIFDNVEDDIAMHDLQVFDFGSLGNKHNDLLEVEMSWILTLCQNEIRDSKNLGIPKHIVMDELWKRMGLLPVVEFVLETLKADRKNLAWATLVTQSLEDLGDFAARIKNACPNTIFLGGAFDRELYREHFRLNARQLDQLESLVDRELAFLVDGMPFIEGGTGYFKVLRMNMDPAAYVRATTKPSERRLREQEGGVEQIKAAAVYRGVRG